MRRLPALTSLAALLAGAVFLATQPAPAPHAPDVPTRLVRDEKPARGPELIRHFFDDWHRPYPGDLGRDLQERIWEEVKAVPEKASALEDDPWTCRGPFGMFGASAARNCGRVLDVDLDSTGIRRVAAASGGIWRLDGITWTPLTDALNTQWIGSLDTSPTNPDLILVGTGEPHIRAGTGLWRSTDGGLTWQNRPLPASPATCFRVRFLPDGQTVVGAFDLGIYRSTNAGLTWSRTALPHWPTDLAIHPANPSVMWTPVQDHGLFRSNNGGITWTQVQGAGLPTSGNGRGAVTISAADPNRLYVAFAGLDNNLLGIFRTDDGGLNWIDVSPPDDYFWGQGWYNNAIGVSPTDPDLVLAGGGGLQRSSDGGLNWTTTATAHVHADVHAIEWTADGANLYVATDGGYSHSTNGGLTYFTSFNRLPITQYVNIDVGNEFPLVMGGGSQDNAVSLTVDGGIQWFVRWGGDGGGFTIDDHDNDRMWATSGLWGGSLLFRCGRSLTGGTSWADINAGLPPSTQWYTRIRSDQAQPPTLYTNNGAQVYASTNLGDLWTAANAVPFPAGVRELTVGVHDGAATAIYACLDSPTTGRRLRVFDGTTWSERDAGLVPGVLVRKVAPHPTDPRRCFALMNGMGTPGSKVYRSDDNGQNWTNITGNLPDVPLADLVAHPDDPQRLYVGTEFGAYASENGGMSWQRWNLGLPEAAIITEMALVDLRRSDGPSSDRLMVAVGTYGRGIWTRPIPMGISAAPQPQAVAAVQMRAAQPNPADLQTHLAFRIEHDGPARLRVFDVRGRVVDTLLDGPVAAGDHAVTCETRHLASGVYFARLETAAGMVSRRITVIR